MLKRVLSLALAVWWAGAQPAFAALPNQLQSARLTDSSLASTIDNAMGNLEVAITDILGIPIGTNISAAMFEATATGLKSVNFQDAAANPTVAGVLQRNAATLRFHDGTAARTLALLATNQTFTGVMTFSEATSPIISAKIGPAAGQQHTIPAVASDTIALLAASQVLTNKTIDCEATGNVCGIPTKFWIPFAGNNAGSAGPICNLPSSSAPAPTPEGSAPMSTASLGYDDTADETCTVSHWLPSDWNSAGAIDGVVVWHAAATTGAATFRLETACVGATTSVIAPTFNAVQYTASTTVNGTANGPNTSAKTGLTTTGGASANCAASTLIYFRVGRDADGTGGTDSMTGDALVDGIEITLRRAI